jgi:hypothetical protein
MLPEVALILAGVIPHDIAVHTQIACRIRLARPFQDLCRRDEVFLVVVVFKSEFVVLLPRALYRDLVSTVRVLSTRSIDRLTRPRVGMLIREAITSAR